MKLVIFDIDGTLTDSYELDESCFIKAVKDFWDIDSFNTDWLSYENNTDAFILREIASKHLGRDLSIEERNAFENHFVHLLDEAINQSPNTLKPIAGAPELLLELIGNADDIAIGISTGALRKSAERKLAGMGIDVLGNGKIAFSSSSEACKREEIILNTEEKLKYHYGVDAFETKLYVGDGIWDAKAARNLGYDFVGRGIGEHAETLKREGALHVFEHYLPKEDFLRKIREMGERVCVT